VEVKVILAVIAVFLCGVAVASALDAAATLATAFRSQPLHLATLSVLVLVRDAAVGLLALLGRGIVFGFLKRLVVDSKVGLQALMARAARQVDVAWAAADNAVEGAWRKFARGLRVTAAVAAVLVSALYSYPGFTKAALAFTTAFFGTLAMRRWGAARVAALLLVGAVLAGSGGRVPLPLLAAAAVLALVSERVPWVAAPLARWVLPWLGRLAANVVWGLGPFALVLLVVSGGGAYLGLWQIHPVQLV
jgi:hypothetical protein